jgi:hypothetical protein
MMSARLPRCTVFLASLMVARFNPFISQAQEKKTLRVIFVSLSWKAYKLRGRRHKLNIRVKRHTFVLLHRAPCF